MAADNPWQKLIEEQEFQDAIHKNGYYQSNLSFQPFVRKYQLTRQRNFVYLFIFPKMDFYNDGILLNDVTKFTPTKIFRINVASLTDNV